MRLKSCWSDKWCPDLWYGWLLAVLIGVGLLMSECAVRPAHAELYLDAAGGLTQFMITTPDGDYLQRGLPHTLDLKSAAYKVGLGWRFNERWSIQGGYVNLGTVKQSAVFVSDENYNPKTSQCLNGCPGQSNYRMTDAYHGGELTITRTFPFNAYSLFIKGGGAYLMHRFTIHQDNGSHTFMQHYGQFPAVVAGLGASYKWAYIEADYYHGLGGSNGFMGHDQGWPLSKEQAVAWAGVKLPLTF